MSASPVETTSIPVSWTTVSSTTIRLLTFRASREELIALGYKHLAFGLVCTWLVGMGRYWDNPRVGLLQHLGVGSVVYVFVLALLLWLIIWPLLPQHWSYLRIAAFVSLVSPPAILYALPVEKFYSIETANEINLLFLTVVATWRVALLIFFVRRLGQLGWFSLTIGTLLPLTLIVVTLTMLNLEKAVFDFMGGVREGTAGDESYAFLALLSFFSVILFIPLVVSYAIIAVSERVAAHEERFKKMYE